MTHQLTGVLIGKDESGKYYGYHGWSASHVGGGVSDVAPLWLDDEVVALVVQHEPSAWAIRSDRVDDNARRLVACWNACRDISTENLEDNAPVKELAHRYNGLLVALQEIVKNDPFNQSSAGIIARAAIEKATGVAA